MKIKAPNKEYTGVIAGVQFINGEAETDDLRLLQWAREKGFEVEMPPEATGGPQQGNDGLDNLTVKELKEIATEAGVDTRGMRKAELIDAIRAVM